jgi:hypothetical protein
LFGSLVVNGQHIWRWDRLEDAWGAAENLRAALNQPQPIRTAALRASGWTVEMQGERYKVKPPKGKY